MNGPLLLSAQRRRFVSSYLAEKVQERQMHRARVWLGRGQPPGSG